jgi:hypothetical protein
MPPALKTTMLGQNKQTDTARMRLALAKGPGCAILAAALLIFVVVGIPSANSF